MHSRGMEWDSSEELDHLEELGDDAIIAQQSGAHPLKPETRVVTEPRTIVVAEEAAHVPPAHTPGRSSRAEATVVIRDRRKVDKMRAKVLRGRTRRTHSSRAERMKALYIWGAVGAGAFVLGGLAAFFVSGSTQASVPASALAAEVPTPVKAREQRPEPPKAKAASAPKAAEPPPIPTEVLDLDELPAETTPSDGTPQVKLDELPVEKAPPKSR